MNNEILEIKKENNNYIINDKDIIIINGLFKYNNILNKRILNKIIKKLNKYHISYHIDNHTKIFIDNKYQYYQLKFIKELELKQDIDIICKYLEDNILRKRMKNTFKEIEIIING